MIKKKDLTRWNRSGLNRFRYIDGNAATLLDTLRQNLTEQFTDIDTKELKWKDLEVEVREDETPHERLDRLLKQYYGDRRDYGCQPRRPCQSGHGDCGHGTRDSHGRRRSARLAAAGAASQGDRKRRTSGEAA